MPPNEVTLESFVANNSSILDELIGTDATELKNLLSNSAISGMQKSQILNQITSASSASMQKTLLNTRLNTFSRVATNTMMKDAPEDTKYVYIGPIDEKTRDECLEYASAGALTEAQIMENGWEASLVDGGGFNCRHKWEIASEEGKKLFEGKKAQNVIGGKIKNQDIVNWKPSMTKEVAKNFVKQSTIKDTIYHGTTVTASESIAKKGFSLKKATTGRIFGDGVYLTTKLQDASVFSMKYNTGTTAVMPIKINVKKMFKFPTDINESGNLKLKIAREITEKISFTSKITKYFQERGYDGIIIPQKDIVGGKFQYSHDWIVVFDPKKITTLEN